MTPVRAPVFDADAVDAAPQTQLTPQFTVAAHEVA